MVIIAIQLLFLLFLAYKLRADLSLGNGFAVSTLVVLIMLILAVFYDPDILFLFLSFLPFVPVVNSLFFKTPIVSKILFELGVPLKVLIRVGIPHSKIEEAIHKAHGIKVPNLDNTKST